MITNKNNVVKGFLDGKGNLKTSNNSLSTSEKGKTLYSYNTPIVYKNNKGKYFLNKNKYSVTTSSQQNIYRNEAKNRNIIFEEVSAQTVQEKVNRSE